MRKLGEKNFTTLQMDIIRLWVEDKSAAEIAKELGCSQQTVYNAKNNSELKQMFYERCNEAVQDLVPLAIQRLKEILKSPKTQATAQIQAIREVLDRSHIKELLNAPESQNVHVTISYE